jgi:hypothetical protein
MKFRATVQLNGKTATGIRVPEEIVAALGPSKRPAVHATVAGYTYRSSVASMHGQFMLPVSATVRESAGVAAGDEVAVERESKEAPDAVLPAAIERDPRVVPDLGRSANRCLSCRAT